MKPRAKDAEDATEGRKGKRIEARAVVLETLEPRAEGAEDATDYL